MQCPDLPTSEACLTLCGNESKVNRVGKICLEIVFISSGWNLFVSLDDTLQ